MCIMKKMKSMNKMLIISLALVTIFAVGCGKKEKMSSYEKAMDEYARDYYDKYMKSVNGINEPTIYLSNLENAVNIKGDSYDMSRFEGCERSSSAIIHTKKDSKEIDSVELHMECEKSSKK